jgi:hypothetical protein
MKPEIWGPPIWTLFHTLAEKIKESEFNKLIPDLFGLIKRICGFLPCPDCSQHATHFLGKISLSQIQNKTDFKNMLYLFHNMVNARKKKPLFNYANIHNYNNIPITPAFNNFIAVYKTKGNMKLLAESFQRKLIIQDLRQWLTANINSFN